jgi:hypothetical protein
VFRFKKIYLYGEQIITDIYFELKKENALNRQIISLLENLFGKNLVLRHIKNAKI